MARTLLRSRTRVVLILAMVVVSLVVGPWPGGSRAHVPPWQVSVAGQPTGMVALGALDPLLSGPGARWIAVAATEGEWEVAPLIREQEDVAAAAWSTAVSLSPERLRPQWGPAPTIDLPPWTGKSAGLAYTLAYLDSAPLNPNPGSLLAGRTVAATGVLHPSGLLLPVGYLQAKAIAASEADSDIMLVPGLNRAFPEELDAASGETTVELVLALSVKDAVRYLCRTGGAAPACAWVYRAEDARFLERASRCVSMYEAEDLRECLRGRLPSR